MGITIQSFCCSWTDDSRNLFLGARSRDDANLTRTLRGISGPSIYPGNNFRAPTPTQHSAPNRENDEPRGAEHAEDKEVRVSQMPMTSLGYVFQVLRYVLAEGRDCLTRLLTSQMALPGNAYSCFILKKYRPQRCADLSSEGIPTQDFRYV